MTGGQLALILTGIVGLAESTWGISSPEKLKIAVEKAVEGAPERNPGLGLFFVSVAVVFWILMGPDKNPSDYALLVLCWILAGGAMANFKANGFQQLAGFLILRRSPTAIRLLYVVELALAATLICIGLMGA
jgi:hypothetical protein